MKVFISWSSDEGNVSRTVAEALSFWLPQVIQAVNPWISTTDITPGKRWNSSIQKELNETTVGIFCVTKDGQHSQWMHFEAGALAKSVDDDSYVIPLLVEMTDRDLEGPLQAFQVIKTTKKDILKLLTTLNGAIEAKKGNFLQTAALERSFERNWGDLETIIETLPGLIETSETLKVEAPVSAPDTPAGQALTSVEVDELLRLTRDTNSTVNKLTRTGSGSARNSPSEPYSLQPRHLYFSINGMSFSIPQFIKTMQEMATARGLTFTVVDTNGPTTLIPQKMILLSGSNLPPESFLHDAAAAFGLKVLDFRKEFS